MLTFQSPKQKKFVMDSISLDNVRLERNYLDSYEQAKSEISNMVRYRCNFKYFLLYNSGL